MNKHVTLFKKCKIWMLIYCWLVKWELYGKSSHPSYQPLSHRNMVNFFYSYEMHLSQYFCGDILYSLVPNSYELNSGNKMTFIWDEDQSN